MIDRSVAMEAKLLCLSLLLATLPTLLCAGSVDDGRALVEEFYRRCNSETRSADLIFVLDSSSSVSRRLLVSMITFVKVLYTSLFNSHKCVAAKQ